jgi:hypothetical protein
MQSLELGYSSQRDKIRRLLAEPSVRQTVEAEVLKEAATDECTALCITAVGDATFALEDADLKQVCSLFGEVTDVKVTGNSSVVKFADVTAAYFALKTLNGRLLEDCGATLSVTWESRSFLPPSYALSTAVYPQKTDARSKHMGRFNIQIENERDFQVARRLIGPNGSNMKRIVEACSQGLQCQAHDVIKLRLRGRGSGFKEGPTHAESAEPLHICVSSKYSDKYALACSKVEELLSKIYRDYDDYCVSRGRSPPHLAIDKTQNDLSLSARSGISESLRAFESCENTANFDIAELLEMRNEARRRCNFSEADRIREVLKLRGISVTDEKGGRGRVSEITTWKFAN